jgi:hypothetical protein
VLDEMQEVRSSTTELARKCERLCSPRRWMVSGTPLYDKISDLQGELYFLRVSPFGAGHEDGFWNHVRPSRPPAGTRALGTTPPCVHAWARRLHARAHSVRASVAHLRPCR